MRKAVIFGILFFMVGIGSAHAQFTSVSGTVQDSSGNVYRNCTGSAVFVPSPTATQAPTLGNPTATFPLTVPIASCNSAGQFTITLADNNIVTDGHTGSQASQWTIRLCSYPGQVPGPTICFSFTTTITGASQSVNTQIAAAALPLPVQTFSPATAYTWTALQTFNAGITGTGTLGSLTAGAGLLTSNNGWSAAQTFDAGIYLGGSTSGLLGIFAPSVAGSSSLTLGVSGNGTAVPTFPAATDTVTENTQTQNLSNKTTTEASSGNNLTLLNFQGPASPITGNGSAQTLYTYTLPANTLGEGKCIRVTVALKQTTGSDNIIYTMTFGGTAILNGGTGYGYGGAGFNVQFVQYVCNSPSSTSTQYAFNVGFGGSSVSNTTNDGASVATTSNAVINMNFNVSSSDAVTPERFLVELIQ